MRKRYKRIFVVSKPKQTNEKGSSIPSDAQMENIIKLGRYSFELEEKREQSIITQAGYMLTAFSVVSAVLIMAIPIVVDYTVVPIDQVLFCAGIVFLCLLASLVLVIIAQWRYKYDNMDGVSSFYKSVMEEPKNYQTQAQFDMQWKAQITYIHDSKLIVNDKRVKYLKASMILFWIAIAILILSCFVLIIVNI